MSEWTCQKLVHDKHDLHTDGWHTLIKCGKPAKYALSSNGLPPTLLCGVHARKYLAAQKPWQKVTVLKKSDTK